MYDCCLVVKVTIATLPLGTGASSSGCKKSGVVVGGQLYMFGRYQRTKRMMSSRTKTTEILDGCNMCLGSNDLTREGGL